ncbi:MAG TPA: ImmA/IrrE family metallo-endopeptidase [bacterium]|nr:ImmA/IrrE family metallo-endopeptidase [bacterium]
MLNGMARFHQYSLFNQFILMIHGCSQVAGYRKWKELERTVKKEEKAVWILAPYFRKEVIENREGEEEEVKGLKGFFSVPVFDIAQTAGKEIERGMTEKANISFEEVRKFVKELGCSMGFRPLEIRQGGYLQDKKIVLNSNLREKDWTSTTIHELAHFLLGHTQANERLTRSLEEQQAETATYLACRELGIKRKSKFYLKSWGLSKNILKDWQEIERVRKKIIRGLSPDRREAPKRSTENGNSSRER